MKVIAASPNIGETKKESASGKNNEETKKDSVTGSKNNPEPSEVSEIGLGSGIQVEVQGLDDYLKAVPSRQLSEFILFLDARPIVGLQVRRVSTSGNHKDTLRFDLLRVKTDRGSNVTSWDALLGSPWMLPGFEKKIPVTVGLIDQPVDSVASANIVIIPKLGGILGLLCVISVIGGIVALGWRTDLLRDSGESTDDKPKTFSLARVQLAVWFCTALASFVFIWSVTGETDSLTAQALSLLGISTMTFIGSAAMDARNGDADQKRIDATKDVLSNKTKQLAAINAELTPELATADVVKTATLSADRAKLAAEISALENGMSNVRDRLKDDKNGKTFFRDILSDEHGISLHRFQLFAWTIVIAAIFLQQVWQKLAMPSNLDGNLLTLMGISSGTFVGMKSTETKASAQLPAAAVRPTS